MLRPDVLLAMLTVGRVDLCVLKLVHAVASVDVSEANDDEAAETAGAILRSNASRFCIKACVMM